MQQDITNKVKKVEIVNKSFKNEQGEAIPYSQLVIHVVINGNQRSIPFKLTADRALVLESIPEPDDRLDLNQQ